MNKEKHRERQLKYWRRRNAELSKIVDAEADEVIRNMREAYDAAAAHIDQQITSWYQKFADDNEITFQKAKQTLDAGELKDFKMTLEEYIRHGEELDEDPSWLKAMKNASAKHHITRLDALKMTAQAELEEAVAKIDGSWMEDAAKKAYLYSLYSTQLSLGVAFNAPNIDMVVRAARKPWTPDGMEFVERKAVNNAKLVQKVQKELTQAAITGEKYEVLAERLSKDFALTQYESMRIIKTESTHLETEASMQAYKDCSIDRYQNLATLDKKTCEVCAEMDLTVWKVTERLDGYNAPPFHPNCRCTTIPYFDDPELATTRAARNAEGKTIFVDDSMSYEEWLEEFAGDAVDEEEAAEMGRLAKAAKADVAKADLLEALRNSVVIGKPYIDPAKIKDEEFSRKFSRITENSNINDTIRSLAQGNITKNNGTYTEMLDIIDIDTGSLIIHKLGEKDTLSVGLTKEEKELIKEYSGRLVSIHNHPTNIPPTGSDFVAAGARGYDFSIVVTHDLKVYIYEPPKEVTSLRKIDAVIDKHTKMLYNDDEKRKGLEKARKELERRFGITWREIE